MAIIDNLNIAVIAQAAQTSMKCLVNNQLASSGTVTTTLALTQDATEDYHWNASSGGFANFPALTNNGVRVGNEPATFAFRFRIQSRGNNNQNFFIMLPSGGLGGSSGWRVVNNGTATGDLQINWVYGSGAIGHQLTVPYTTGDIITVVSRADPFNNGASATHDLWIGTTGRVGTSPDQTATFSAWSNFSNTESHPYFYGTSDNDFFEFAAWNALKTDAECAALADDLRGELETALGAANLAPTETTPIGTINATVGVALTYDLTQNFSDDGDILNFAVNSGGTALPSWASISTTNIVGTPTSGDVGTTTGHVLDFDDGVNATDQSTAFSITVSALPRITTAPVTSGASVLASTGGMTIEIHSVTTGALVLRLTAQTTESDGTLIINSASLSDATDYSVMVINTGTGERGVRVYTAAIP